MTEPKLTKQFLTGTTVVLDDLEKRIQVLEQKVMDIVARVLELESHFNDDSVYE